VTSRLGELVKRREYLLKEARKLKMKKEDLDLKIKQVNGLKDRVENEMAQIRKEMR
jgi:hypothetical protein